METNPAIREVKFIPKDQAAADFQAYLGSDFVEFLQTNPLPDSYEVKLDGRSAETGALSALEKQVMGRGRRGGLPAERDRAGYVQHQ